MMFKGSITALLTPFKNSELDTQAFEKFVTWQWQEGTHGVVVGGTTGESPTLTKTEVTTLTEIALGTSHKGAPVIVGTGTNSTLSTIEKTLHAQKLGVSAALVVVPYYNKPSQEGLFQHYKAVHDATDIPIILYDVPGRSCTGLTFETVVRLAELPRIVGIKDSTSKLSNPIKFRKSVKDTFALLCGEDDLAAAFLLYGGHGNISAVANVAPKLCAAMQNAWGSGDVKKVMEINAHLQPLFANLFCESNPIPAKYAAHLLGLMGNEMRLPMVPPLPASQTLIRETLVKVGLLPV